MSFRKRAPVSQGTDRTNGSGGSLGSNDPLELWFALARREWSCLVMAPACPNGGADELAKAVADAGQHLSEHRVSAVTIKMLGPDSVRALSTLAAHFSDRRSDPRLRDGEAFDRRRLVAHPFAPGSQRARVAPGQVGPVEPEVLDADNVEPLEVGGAEVALPSGQLIISIPSVIVQPLGIAVARASDGVLLVVEIGRTAIADLNRTVEAIGREHILGTCLVSSPRSARRRG